MNRRKTGSLFRDTRGLTSAEWLIIGALLLLGAGAAFQLVSGAVDPKGGQVAGIIATGQGDVGNGGPGSVGGPGGTPGDGSMPAMGGVAGYQAYQLAGLQSLGDSIGGFFSDLFKGALLGDFNEDASGGALTGQILLGFVPIAGQIGDARDTIAAIKDVYNGKDGAWGSLGIAAIAWVPGVGDAAKGVLRGADGIIKNADGIAKNADEIAGGLARGGLRSADEAIAGIKRAEDAGPVLYRGENRTPDEIFSGGLRPKGEGPFGRPLPEGPLEYRVKADADYPTGEFVNLTSSREVADKFAQNRDGFVYVVDTKKPGISTNDVLGSKSPHPHEMEHKFPGEGVNPHEIVGAYNVKTGEWIPNPHYTPSVPPTPWWKFW